MVQAIAPVRPFPSRATSSTSSIVGSGAAGGIIAKELSTAGFSVVVLEQGPRLTEADFDPRRVRHAACGTSTPTIRRRSRRRSAPTPAGRRRSRPVADLRPHGRRQQRALHRQLLAPPPERLQRGEHARRRRRHRRSPTGRSPTTSSSRTTRRSSGSSASRASPGPFDPPRSKPYPMPPLPVKSSGVLLERGARRSACTRSRRRWRSTRSRTTAGRRASTAASACSSCASSARSRRRWRRCCRWRRRRAAARSGRTATSRASRPSADGRATGVSYFDAQKRLQLQRARAVVLCANGAETPRLLLNSATSRFPHGLANSSGMVGKHLMFNTYFGVDAQFEHPLNEYKSVQNTRIVHDFYDTDPKRGLLRRRRRSTRASAATRSPSRCGGLPPGAPTWGEGFARALAEQFTRIDVLRLPRHVAAARDQQRRDRSGR